MHQKPVGYLKNKRKQIHTDNIKSLQQLHNSLHNFCSLKSKTMQKQYKGQNFSAEVVDLLVRKVAFWNLIASKSSFDHTRSLQQNNHLYSATKQLG